MHDDLGAGISVPSIRIVSIVEAKTVTGPIKPLLMFSRHAQTRGDLPPKLYHSLITTVRGRATKYTAKNLFLEAAVAAGVSVDIVPERFLFDPGILPKIAGFLTQRAPQIIETHDFKSHFLVWLLKRAGKVPDARWLAFHHGYTKMSARVLVYQQLDRISLPSADRVVTLCKPFVRQLVDRGVSADRIHVIANAIEPRDPPSTMVLEELRRELGILAADRVVLSVGRLSAEKGQADLIAAFRRLMGDRNSRGLRLVFVGDGGEASRLRSLAADLGDRVLFVGHRADPWPFYGLAEVFVLPSHTEGSPLVLFEAMAAGLPIVASAVGGIPEVVESRQTALLVPAADVDRLSAALGEVLNDAKLHERLGTAARQALQRFTPEQYADRMVAIYRGLLAIEQATGDRRQA